MQMQRLKSSSSENTIDLGWRMISRLLKFENGTKYWNTQLRRYLRINNNRFSSIRKESSHGRNTKVCRRCSRVLGTSFNYLIKFRLTHFLHFQK